MRESIGREGRITELRVVRINDYHLISTLPTKSQEKRKKEKYSLPQNLIHLKHINPLNIKNILHPLIAYNLLLIQWILEIMAFDVFPEFLDYLWTRHLWFA